ncbi:CBS domain-containing protein [Desulfonatronospira sp.]|uniref:CBS domain-containing protein n=1 Tax=Desulfonatronospira sp. TaxID=1962951 RepID=UPI0025B8C1DD|nr:CBS domain-containing protein [Desulfonatronospira sp.]
MLNVKDLMTQDLFTLQETDNLALARSLMDLARIRHIPIVDENMGFTGLITHRDILEATVSKLAGVDTQTQEELDRGIPVREIMNTNVKTITPDDNLRDAAGLLLEHKYGCLPVLMNGKLVGILTEADFLSLTISLIDALEEGPELR